MKILKSSITIIAEIVILIIAFIWYRNTNDYEPLIMLIASGVGLVTSLISKYASRPKIELHHEILDYSRLTKGYTANNPPIIRVGIDTLNQYWELTWHYSLEIRNNSSLTAYSIQIEYLNVPKNTIVKGEIGKIEPILANSMKEFKIKIIQNITGSHIDADEYLKTNIVELMKNAKIIVKYKDENRTTFYTEFDWSTDSNQFKLFK